MIQHVALEIRPADADACVAFWALLGFAELAPPASLSARARWVARRGTQVHLLYADDPVVPVAGHVAVLADDLDAVVAALASAGHEVQRRREHWGAPRALAVDPAGHRVELMAAAPPADGPA